MQNSLNQKICQKFFRLSCRCAGTSSTSICSKCSSDHNILIIVVVHLSFYNKTTRILFEQSLFYYPPPVETRTPLTTRIERSNLIIQPAGYIRRNTVIVFFFQFFVFTYIHSFRRLSLTEVTGIEKAFPRGIISCKVFCC